MTNPPEEQLTTRAVGGDQAALSELLEAHQNRLYNTVYRMVGHAEDAAELTQEAMLKIIQNIAGFKGRSAIGTWMIRIAMNLSLSHLRKAKLRRTTSLDGSPTARFTGHDDQLSTLKHHLADSREPGPPARVQQQEGLEHLHDALGTLKDDLRAVLVLRDIEEMDYQQISVALSVPVGTVKSRLFRARLALRQALTSTDQAAQTGQASDSDQPPTTKPTHLGHPQSLRDA